MGEVWKYWAHVWNKSGRKCVVIFWNAVVLGEHLVYKSKHDAMHQGKKRSFETEPKLSFQLNFIQPAYTFFIGKIIGTIPKECVEDAISIIKARREQKKKEERKEKKRVEREEILKLLRNLSALQNK